MESFSVGEIVIVIKDIIADPSHSNSVIYIPKDTKLKIQNVYLTIGEPEVSSDLREYNYHVADILTNEEFSIIYTDIRSNSIISLSELRNSKIDELLYR